MAASRTASNQPCASEIPVQAPDSQRRSVALEPLAAVADSTRAISRVASIASSAAIARRARVEQSVSSTRARFGERRGDAGRFDLPGRPAARPRRFSERFGPARAIAPATRASSRLRSAVEAGDGRVDRVGVEAAPGEPLAELRFGQLAPREHLSAAR